MNTYPINVFKYEVARSLRNNWLIRNEKNATKFVKQFDKLVKQSHAHGNSIKDCAHMVYIETLIYINNLAV